MNNCSRLHYCHGVSMGPVHAILGNRIFGSWSGIGVFHVALGQIGSVQIDIAENTSTMVKMMKEKEYSAAKQQPHTSAPAGSRGSVSSPSRPPDRTVAVLNLIKAHRGRQIIREAVGGSVNCEPFSNVLTAEKWIESKAINRLHPTILQLENFATARVFLTRCLLRCVQPACLRLTVPNGGANFPRIFVICGPSWNGASK
jgi:hypothetical protein